MVINIYVLILLLIIISLFIAFLIISVNLDKKRTEAMRAFAFQRRLSFNQKPAHNLRDSSIFSNIGSSQNTQQNGSFILEKFNLFERGYSKSVQNLIEGKISRERIRVFDYSYVTGSGKSRDLIKTTVVIISPDNKLPNFLLRTEYFIDKVKSLVGFDDINFDMYPVFSKKYWLSSNDEAAVRNAFSSGVISFFESLQRPPYIEVLNSQILVYYPRRTVMPEKLQGFIDTAISVAKAFRK